MRFKLDALPAWGWIRTYRREELAADLTAGLIVTVLLIPQSLAYAMLAGVPPEVGLYSSILPLIAYAMLGTSRTLSVGPVAVVSLMTATALGSVAAQQSASYLTGAVTLALLSGVMLMAMGFLRMGLITNLLSHTVISGFISASAVIIALSQVGHLLGIKASGDTLTELLPTLFGSLPSINWPTCLLGMAALASFVLLRNHGKSWLTRLGLAPHSAGTIARVLPVGVVFISIALVWLFNLDQLGIAVTGVIPEGLPVLSLQLPDTALIKALALPALLISIIGYVESISVGKTLGSKRRQRIDANQELIGLGAASLASGLSGGFPVTGGFSRSVVNFEAGAATQAASVFAAIGIALASLFLTPVLYFLPKAVLAATIIVAVLALIDFTILKKTWRFSRSDFVTVLATILVTMFYGVEVGVAGGVVLSVMLHLYNTSRPHIAEVGLIEGSEHFRNVRRYQTITSERVLTLRPDESLFFTNVMALEAHVTQSVYERGSITDVVILCSAVNEIDFSALESLELMNHQLADQGITLHLSEVKGPVMDKLANSGFLEQLSGQVFISQYQAFTQLS